MRGEGISERERAGRARAVLTPPPPAEERLGSKKRVENERHVAPARQKAR